MNVRLGCPRIRPDDREALRILRQLAYEIVHDSVAAPPSDDVRHPEHDGLQPEGVREGRHERFPRELRGAIE